jgi:hypothetical protein
MKMSVRMDRKDAIPVREWEEFLAHARRIGASDDAMVTEDYDDDDRQPSGYLIEVSGTEDAEAPEVVLLPTDLVHDLLHVVKVVASSGGDVRGLETAAK